MWITEKHTKQKRIAGNVNHKTPGLCTAFYLCGAVAYAVESK